MTSGKQRLDGEINYRALVWLTLGLVALVALAFVLMWQLAQHLYGREKAQDPPPPIMIEARLPHEPPGPRLQSDPFAELALLEAAADAHLSSYGWIDQAAGLAHVPIERAMELVVENGLPEPVVIDVAAPEPPGN